MYTYQLRDRILQYLNDANRKYPAKAIINLYLEPLTQFGGLPGESRNSVTDKEMKAKFNLSTGRSRIVWEEQLFEPLEASTEINKTKFQIKKNVVTVSAICNSEQELFDLISTMYYAFPAVLNVHFPDVPFPTHAWGNINNHKFNWNYDPKSLPPQLTVVTSKRNQQHLVLESWRQMTIVLENRRLMGGLLYFHVACRLLEAGYTRFEFMAEALLNFAKSVQATFGESHDEVRQELQKLDIFDKDEIEAKIIPALILRNEFDIAHVSLSTLNFDQLKALHSYTHLAEGSVRTLFKSLIEELSNKTYELPKVGPDRLSNKKAYTLKKLEKNIKPYI